MSWSNKQNMWEMSTMILIKIRTAFKVLFRDKLNFCLAGRLSSWQNYFLKDEFFNIFVCYILCKVLVLRPPRQVIARNSELFCKPGRLWWRRRRQSASSLSSSSAVWGKKDPIISPFLHFLNLVQNCFTFLVRKERYTW